MYTSSSTQQDNNNDNEGFQKVSSANDTVHLTTADADDERVEETMHNIDEVQNCTSHKINYGNSLISYCYSYFSDPHTHTNWAKHHLNNGKKCFICCISTTSQLHTHPLCTKLSLVHDHNKPGGRNLKQPDF